jgi:predicted nucleotidyltransferase component of viral defense system
MIDRAEILAVAGELSLSPDVVEKDYVLGWLLACIFAHATLAPAWIFKGDTCLKKCFFETYRFSEDLDFTLREGAELDTATLTTAFSEIASWIYDRVGIDIPVSELRFQTRLNPRSAVCVEGRVYYNGPLRRVSSLPRIKLDLTADEIVVLPPIQRSVAHPYSDCPSSGFSAQCYAYEEIFAEKMRALGERTRPRDLYDVVNLFRHGEFRPAASAVRDVLRRKCDFKGIAVPTVSALTDHLDDLVGEWRNMLGHQLPVLPPFESFWQALPEVFVWLVTGNAPVLPTVPLGAREAVFRPRIGSFRGRGYAGTSSLENIRFAAANRLCVELDYIDEEGRRRVRTIEPYSLRVSDAGNVRLIALRADSGETRSYRLDRIQGAVVTTRTFVPRFEIELTPTGAIYMPPPPLVRPARRPARGTTPPRRRKMPRY